jgi:hypothetical protein
MPGDVVHAVAVQVDAVGAAVAPDLHRQVGVVGPVDEVNLERECLKWMRSSSILGNGTEFKENEIVSHSLC